MVADAWCGCIKTLFNSKKRLFIFGSFKKTSNPAPYILSFSKESNKEFSSITEPLEILMTIPSLPRALRKSAETKPLVESPPFKATNKFSTLRHNLRGSL